MTVMFLIGIPRKSWQGKDVSVLSSPSLLTSGQIHIQSANPYVEPFFDSGFMNNKADFAPIRWSYKKTREVARRMDGKAMFFHFAYTC